VGCATVLGGRYQDVTFDSAPSAELTVVDEKDNIVLTGTTPFTVGLLKREQPYRLYFYKDGYQEKSGVLETSVNEHYLVNGLALGPLYFIGTLVDKSTGAKWEYPPRVFTRLEAGASKQTEFAQRLPYTSPKLYFEASGGAGGGGTYSSKEGSVRIGRVIGDSNWIFAGYFSGSYDKDYSLYYIAPSFIYYPIPMLQISAIGGVGYMSYKEESHVMGSVIATVALDWGAKNAAVIGLKYQGGFYDGDSFQTYGPFLGYRFSSTSATQRKKT